MTIRNMVDVRICLYAYGAATQSCQEKMQSSSPARPAENSRCGVANDAETSDDRTDAQNAVLRGPRGYLGDIYFLFLNSRTSL